MAKQYLSDITLDLIRMSKNGKVKVAYILTAFITHIIKLEKWAVSQGA